METKPIPVKCANVKQIEQIACVNENIKNIIQNFLPGALTLVLPVKDLPEEFTNGLSTIAIRIPDEPFLLKVIEALETPLFVTSANQSGQPVCTSLDEIEKQCPLLDGMMEGTVSFGQASTIVDGTKADLPILRQGPLTKEQILNVLK